MVGWKRTTNRIFESDQKKKTMERENEMKRRKDVKRREGRGVKGESLLCGADEQKR